MPVCVPPGLPAIEALAREGIPVFTKEECINRGANPIEILLLNIMPNKIKTEIQFLRILGVSPLWINVTLLYPSSHEPVHTPREYISRFYKTLSEIESKRFDGLIITGAPVELLEFEEVDYWEELKEIMEWGKQNVFSTIYICWAAQAGLYYHYGIKKYPLNQKLSGVYKHQVTKRSIFLWGHDDAFWAPHSRYTEVREEDIEKVEDLEILARSEDAGVYIVVSKDERQIFVTGHPEYDRNTLKEEYERDMKKGLDVPIPANYFPSDDPNRPPILTWSSHAHLFFNNWLGHIVYRDMPNPNPVAKIAHRGADLLA